MNETFSRHKFFEDFMLGLHDSLVGRMDAVGETHITYKQASKQIGNSGKSSGNINSGPTLD